MTQGLRRRPHRRHLRRELPGYLRLPTAADGANDMSSHVQYMMANCPNTRLVLGGFSQGGGGRRHRRAAGPGGGLHAPLPASAPDHVAAIALFGNPSAKAGLPLTISPTWASRPSPSSARRRRLRHPGHQRAVHSTYPESGQTAMAADFVAARV